MEENVKNEVVEMMTKVDPETLAEANETLLNKAIADTVSELPAVQHKPVSNGKNLAIGIGTFCGGVAVGAAIDHFVVPAVSKALEKLKEKRAAKKADKAAKKAAKAKAKETKPEPAPEAPTANDGIDPNTIDTTVKD